MGSVLQEKVIIVTGAGGGIGECVAEEAARQGARVVVNDLGKNDDGENTADIVTARITENAGRAVASHDNVAEWDGAARVIETAMDQWGRIDGIVNNAGVLRDKIFHKMTEEEWDQSLHVNLKGSFNIARNAAPILKEQQSGAFVHMTSTSGLIGNFGQANYSAGKIGLVGLSKSIALDMQRFNVRSNCIAPFAMTPMVMAGVPRETEEDKARWKVIERLEPRKVAPLTCALLSDAAEDVNGQVFGARANEVILFSQPRPLRTMHIGDEEGITTEAVVERALPLFRPSFYALDRSMDVFTWDPI